MKYLNNGNWVSLPALKGDPGDAAADGSIVKRQLADSLLDELGLDRNHHLTTVKAEWIPCSWHSEWETYGEVEGYTETNMNANGFRTKLLPTPQFIKIVNRMSSKTPYIRIARFCNRGDEEADDAIFYVQRLGYHNQEGIHRELGFMDFGEIPANEEITRATFEYGRKGLEYMQMYTYKVLLPSTRPDIDIYFIYDSYRHRYEIPSDDGEWLEDLPIKYVAQGANAANSSPKLFGVVPYYPNFTYKIRGGNYSTSVVDKIDVYPLFDDSLLGDTLYRNVFFDSGTPDRVPFIAGLQTTQFDTSVKGGANEKYRWAYFTTPDENTYLGAKYLAFDMGWRYEDDARYSVAGETDEERIAYYQALIQDRNDAGLGNLYVTRWEEQVPRRMLSVRVKRNPELPADDGGKYHGLLKSAECPLADRNWVLFGDSLTDNYGGHDMTSNYFASKIAREFGINFDNRAKSGSNINTASNGVYTSVNGCAMLDAYIAEVEAGNAPTPDYITVAFGSNSFAEQLGSVEDTSDSKNTVCGAVKYFIEQIRTRLPSAVIGFVLPPQSTWETASYSTTKTVEGGRNAIKSVIESEGYQVPYVDMWTQSGITVDMLPDDIHISSEQAQNFYYHAMRRFMMGL